MPEDYFLPQIDFDLSPRAERYSRRKGVSFPEALSYVKYLHYASVWRRRGFEKLYKRYDDMAALRQTLSVFREISLNRLVPEDGLNHAETLAAASTYGLSRLFLISRLANRSRYFVAECLVTMVENGFWDDRGKFLCSWLEEGGDLSFRMDVMVVQGKSRRDGDSWDL